MIMEQRQSGEKRTLGINKRKKGVSGHDGRVTHPAQEHSGSRLSVKRAPPATPSSNTHIHSCSSVQVQMHLEESKQPQKAQNPKWMSVCVWERKGKKGPRCFLALASLSLSLLLPTCLVGCLRVRGRVCSVVTSTRCAPLTQITKAVDMPHKPESSRPTTLSHTPVSIHEPC